MVNKDASQPSRLDSHLFAVLEAFADVCNAILPGALAMFLLLWAIGGLK